MTALVLDKETISGSPGEALTRSLTLADEGTQGG